VSVFIVFFISAIKAGLASKGAAFLYFLYFYFNWGSANFACNGDAHHGENSKHTNGRQ
jgi:hypothetical protein